MVNINIFGGGTKHKKTMTQRFREFMNKVDENSDIQIVIKTLGGSYTENKMMTDWIRQHKGKVTVIVPEYAFSSGSFVAFYADEIIMHKRAHLSPVDPQLSLPLVGALSYTVPTIARSPTTMNGQGTRSRWHRSGSMCIPSPTVSTSTSWKTTATNVASSGPTWAGRGRTRRT